MSNPLKIIITEDEFPIALDTEMKLTQKGYQVIGIAQDFGSLIDLITEDTPDVILMDINLGKGGNGIEIAKKLKKIVAVPIVFLSAYSNPEVVEAALETEPFGYLVKPYKIEDLTIALELARKQWLKKLQISMLTPEKKEEESVFVQNGSKITKINISEIIFLQALDNYSIIQTETNKTVVSSYLSQLFSNFSSCSDFMQIHRSYVINLKKIKSINGNMAMLQNFEIPISRSHKNELLGKLKLV